MRKFKYLFVTACAVFLCVMAFQSSQTSNTTLRAESAPFSASPSFSLYNKVRFADKDFTIIKTESSLELLSDASAGDELTWNEAVNKIIQYQTTFGTLGNSYISNASLPSSTDISPLMNGTHLNDGIPKISTDWWLGDSSKDNRSKFIDENNNTEKEMTYDRRERDGDSCKVNSKIENGTKPTTNKDADIQFNKITGRTGVEIDVGSSYGGEYTYNDNQCTKGWNMTPSTNKYNVFLNFDSNGQPSPQSGGNNNSIQLAIAGMALNQGLELKVGSSIVVTTPRGECQTFTGMPAMKPGYSVYFRGMGSATVKVVSLGSSTTSPVKCTGLAQEVGKSSLRPKISLNASDIAYINSSKRVFEPMNSISQEVLQSNPIGSNNYLTMRSQDLKVQLDDTSKEVSGTTLTTSIYNNSYIKIPVKVSGTSEGSKYVSASATINGTERYAILKEVSGSTDVVELDISNFAEHISDISTLNLTLYQENSGDYDTAYIGEGTNITIKIIKSQEIAFDDNQETTLEYGADLELTSLLTSSINDQADSDIVYSIKEGNATITAQSYDKTNGKATATIHPTNGIGTVVIAINKAGDGDILAASEKTYSINLSKKKAVIYPKKPSKAYTLGDQMFTVESESTDLENDDTIPNTIVPELINTDNSNTPPDNNGTINAIGTWKLLYPVNILDNIDTTDFGKKYDIELKDYDDDTSYIFESVITDIPSGWIIVTPNANAKGWNNGTVTINLSDEAKSLGYTEIEVISPSNEILNHGSSIVYDKETSSITPLIRLKKGDTTTSSETTREIKIDVKKPTVNVALEKESDWATKKTVTITASDALSGIDTITVSLNGTPYTVTQDSTDTSVYTFEADQEGTYDIVVTDLAGNTNSLTQKVEKIDTSTVTLSAVAENLTEDQPKQKITLTFDAGTSGIDTFKVYYKGSGDSEYKFYKNLETTITSPYDFDACMNGSFKFELINKAGSSAEDTVEITHVNPPKPVTKIDATWEKDTTKTYTSNTWTNQNVMLTLSNINPAITGDITWQISEDGTTWTDLDSNTKLVSTDSVFEKTYQFKSKIGEVTEEEAQSFTVKIDKTKPAVPVIDHHEDYISSAWFENGFDVTTSVVSKEHNTTIGQDIYVCDGKKADCISTSSLWKKTNKGTYAVSGNAKHELYFKTIDEAGNESELTSPAYINLNNTAPVITISLNESKIKDILHTITLGFFFKDTVNITFDVEYGLDTGGTVKYILDKNANRSTPLPDASDSRWVEGTSDSLTPDDKAMIYVMATSAAGVTTIESSEYNVYADKTPPVITIPDTSAWTKETTLDVEIKDALSGVDVNAVEYKIDQGAYVSASIAKDTMTISGLSDGTYDIFVNASDYSGNRLTKDAKTTVHIDTVAPVIGAITPAKTGWISEQKITFTASDALSGLDGLPVITGTDHKALTVTENEDGSYSCTITKNDTYTVSVKDLAGNETTTSYAETHIDTEPPVITNIVIDHENDWKASKKVSFDVTDTSSEVDYVIVTYEEQGVEKQVTVSGPVGDSFSFTANLDATYTITAYDKAGNQASETVTVEQIDPDGLKIINISDTSTWVKDQMIVTFEVQSGNTTLKADEPKVIFDGNPLSLTNTNGVYSFVATQNGTYTISAENDAADTVSETLVIHKIDTLKPVIKDISDTATASAWRDPVDVSFHVYDYNSNDETTIGSGVKAGYPKVYIIKDGSSIPIQLTQDTTDLSLFTFLAEYNTTYYVEAQDAVAHEVVEEQIVVDHILGPDVRSEISVLAENDGTPIASGTWAKGEILFTISGGLDASALEKYQVASTADGSTPEEADWMDLNEAATHQHKVTGNVDGVSYWYRALPSTSDGIVSEPFVVKLDNARPENLTITLTPKNTNAFASFINAVTFGNWLKQEQVVTFSASDNFTPEKDMRYEYAEKADGVLGTWKPYTGSLSYSDVESVLYARAIDLAGNISDERHVSLEIDCEPPVITGVKDQKEYKQYYLPRYVTVEDKGSGVSTATYTKQNEAAVPIVGETRIFGTGDYVIDAEDVAGNTTTLAFRIVNLPDIETEIDGSDESRDIIDQITKELEEVKEKIDDNEKNNYEKWITDAEDKWNNLRRKVVEDEETTSKVEGQGDTTFDPKTELIVEEIPKEEVPVLPRNAIKTYDVYLKKGNNVVQANGTVKVYLPYDEKEVPIVYEISEDGTITEISAIQEDGYVTFITDTLSQYAISNTAQEETKPDPTPNPDPTPKPDPTPTPNPDPNPDEGSVCVAGPDGKLGTEDDVCVDPGDNELPDKNPDGSIDVPGGGTIVFPDGEEVPIGPNDTGTLNPDGSVEIKPSGDKYGPDGKPIKPDTCPNEGSEINIDTNKDGKPDINIDTDGDCKADLNIDTDGDHIPDINIDTTLDGKPDYNIDSDEDGKPDVNIGPVNDPWKPTVCKSVGALEYCSDSYKAPYLNVDTDGDGRPDLNLDLDGDLEADLNIDVDGDWIPDVNIDSTGDTAGSPPDGEPDINVDIDNDGKADKNLVKLTKWTPNKDVDGKIKYDTMTGLVPDPELNKNPNDGGYLSGTGSDVLNTSAQGGAYTNADTGDIVKTSFWWILVLINGGITLYFLYKRRKQKAE